MKIMTPIEPSSVIWERFTYIPPPRYRVINTLMKMKPTRKLGRITRAILYSWKLRRCSRDHDVIVTDSDYVGNCFALLQFLFGKKIHHVMKDCLWRHYPNPVSRFVKKTQLRFTGRVIDKFVVMSQPAKNYYAEYFGISPDKFTPFLFHSTLGKEFKGPVVEGSYLFSGGNGNRDYKTLLRAVNGLRIDVRIASTEMKHFRKVTIPSNVRIKGVSHNEFIRQMATSRMVVVAMKKCRLHTGGEQTILNAMTLGKPTIITNDREAADYIADGKTGFLVRAGDISTLRRRIVWIIEHPEDAAEMGRRAQEFASQLTTEEWHRKIYGLCEYIIGREYG